MQATIRVLKPSKVRVRVRVIVSVCSTYLFVKNYYDKYHEPHELTFSSTMTMRLIIQKGALHTSTSYSIKILRVVVSHSFTSRLRHFSCAKKK